jgi:small redox-active disulfide protein 2
MKKIQVLGPGCANCSRLASVAEDVAKELGLEYEMEKVTEITAIVGFGVMKTPALAVDGKVLISGRVPSREEIRKLLQ